MKASFYTKMTYIPLYILFKAVGDGSPMAGSETSGYNNTISGYALCALC